MTGTALLVAPGGTRRFVAMAPQPRLARRLAALLVGRATLPAAAQVTVGDDSYLGWCWLCSKHEGIPGRVIFCRECAWAWPDADAAPDVLAGPARNLIGGYSIDDSGVPLAIATLATLVPPSVVLDCGAAWSTKDATLVARFAQAMLALEQRLR